MLKTIWKYNLPLVGEAELNLPVGAQCLSVGVQRSSVVMWVLVDDESMDRERRRFRVAQTGESPGHSHEVDKFIGSATMMNSSGVYVVHVFEEPAP